MLPRLAVVGLTLTEKIGEPLTVKIVFEVLLLPAASVAVTVMVCDPTPTSVPPVGLCCKLTGPTRSEAVTRGSTFGIAA